MKLTIYSVVTALLSQLQTYILISVRTNISRRRASFLHLSNFTDAKKVEESFFVSSFLTHALLAGEWSASHPCGFTPGEEPLLPTKYKVGSGHWR